METLANLESFVRSAEAASFSAAARRLALTPAAVSRNVSILERNLGVRLFQRSTRKLALTEDGERFLSTIRDDLEGLQAAISDISGGGGAPAGILKVSLPPTFGVNTILPLLPEFLTRYPAIRIEWHFENRAVDLIGEGVDAAIGGGFELSPGVVSRVLIPSHLIAVAAPAYLAGRSVPHDPAGLAGLDGIVLRSGHTGRISNRAMRNLEGVEMPVQFARTIVFNDPTAMVAGALLGLGVSVVLVADVIDHLESGGLQRLMPDWYADAGSMSIYYPSRTLLPGKTRVFVDFIVGHFKSAKLARQFAVNIA